jgi:iron complex outermembrane receptor protein
MKKPTVYIHFFIVLLWLSTLPAWAQHTLSGKVSDADGGPLPGAAVTVEGTYKGTFTDVNGTFYLTNLKPSTVSIQVSMLGYETQQQVIDPSKNEALSIKLSKTAVAVDEVVVSATRANQKSAIAYTDVTRRELNKLNLGQDIPQLLNFTPSIVTTSVFAGPMRRGSM